MKVQREVLEGVGPEKLREAQDSDSSLDHVRELSRKEEIQATGKFNTYKYFQKDGILFRHFQSPKHNNGEPVKQLVVPVKYRNDILKLAHESVFGGHLGTQKTADKVMSQFHWPGLIADVKRHCASCDQCQRTTAKGKVKREPLVEMPLIETPFSRVAIDLIGPINPSSERWYKYILTVIDYATRYPEAVPLKNIETETVAEAMVEIFSRVGVPREVLSDQGSQFLSGLMKEVSRLCR